MRFTSLKDDSFDTYIAYPDKKFCLVLKEGGNFALVTLISRSGDNVRISDVYLVFTSLLTEIPPEENRNLLDLFRPEITVKRRNQYQISVQGRDPVTRSFDYTAVMKKTVSVMVNNVRRRGKINDIRLEKKLIIDDQLSFEYQILLPDTEEKVWVRGDTIEKIGKNKEKTVSSKTSSSQKKKTSASKASHSKPKTSKAKASASSAKKTNRKQAANEETKAEEKVPDYEEIAPAEDNSGKTTAKKTRKKTV